MPGHASGLNTKLLIGFLAGALAIPLFHQVGLILLSFLRGGQLSVYGFRPVAPFGVPQLFNQMFWGGLWGMVYALIAPRFSMPGWAKGLVFGATLPVLVGWFVVAPLKGQPVAAGWDLTRMIWSPVINGFFGLGIGLLYPVLRGMLGRR